MGFGGFLKGLGKVARLGLQFAPIPGAGIAGKLLSGAAKAAPILSGMAAGRAAGTQQEEQAQIARDRLGLERTRYGNEEALAKTRMGNEALQQEFANKLRLNSMGARRSILSSFNNSGVKGLPHLDLSAMGGPLPMAPTSQSPTLSPYGAISGPAKSNFMDKLLSVAGPASALAGAFHNSTQQPQAGVPGMNLPTTPPYIDPRFKPGKMGPAYPQDQFMGWGG